MPESDRKIQKQRNIENNANNIRNAAEVAIATKNPYAMAVGGAIKAADRFSGGRTTRALGKSMNTANKISPGGRKIQRLSNKLSESGTSDKIGQAASIKSSFGSGGAASASSAGEKSGNFFSQGGKGGKFLAPNSKKTASNDGIIKGFWNNLSPILKLKIIAVCAGLVFFVLIIFTIVAALSGSKIEAGSAYQNVESENMDEAYDEFWDDYCKGNNCTEEMQEQVKALKEAQIAFYNRLNELKNKYSLTNIQRDLLVTTVFLGYEDVDFGENSEVYNINENEEEDTTLSSEAYYENRDTLNQLASKFTGSDPNKAYFDYLEGNDFFDKRKALKTYYRDYAINTGLSVETLTSWSDIDKKNVRLNIINEIKSFVEDYNEKDISSNNTIASLSTNWCPNGITVKGHGTMSLDDFVAGVVAHEMGGYAAKDMEVGKIMSVAVRSFALADTNNCQKTVELGVRINYFDRSQWKQNYNGTDEQYDIFLKQAAETSGEVIIDESDNPIYATWITIPAKKYYTLSNGMYTFYMQGIINDERTNYTYTISADDVNRIAKPAGGIIYPSESSNHHWGISSYALVKMAEEGLTYNQIIERTYLTGGVARLVKGLAISSEEGLQINSTGTFLMRVAPVSPDSGNPYYNFNAKNYGQCAWYAQERSDEILSTMGWTKTAAWILNKGNGGNGGYYCYHPAYQGYIHHTNFDDPETFKPGSLISWSKNNEYGHVAVIEDVIGDNVIISEAWIDNPNTGHQTIRTVPKENLRTYGRKKYNFTCTIDLSTGGGNV